MGLTPTAFSRPSSEVVRVAWAGWGDTWAWVATTSTWAEHLAATRASPSSSDKKLEIHLQHSAPPPLCAQFYQFLPVPRSPPINSVTLIGSISRLFVSLEMINKPILYLQ